MPAVKLRPSARAIVLDEHDRILLCRFELEREGSPVVVWATPGGGVEPGETLLEALRRELREEVGLEVTGDRRTSGIRKSSAPGTPRDTTG